MSYFASGTFCSSLVHKKNFVLILHMVFKIGYLVYQRRKVPLLS